MDDTSTDDTFASTLSGIHKLRENYGDGDWRDWRRTVIKAVESGEALERKVERILRALDKFALDTAVRNLVSEVANLKADAQRRRGMRSKFWARMCDFALVLAGALLTKFVDKLWR